MHIKQQQREDFLCASGPRNSHSKRQYVGLSLFVTGYTDNYLKIQLLKEPRLGAMC